MNTDRELLELAAKAAGVCLHPEDQLHRSYGNWGCDTTCMACKRDPSDARWLPLADDGDALRLAVTMAKRAPGGVLCLSIGTSTACEFNYVHGPDAAANTRRAIVVAAAKFGEAMP